MNMAGFSCEIWVLSLISHSDNVGRVQEHKCLKYHYSILFLSDILTLQYDDLGVCCM